MAQRIGTRNNTDRTALLVPNILPGLIRKDPNINVFLTLYSMLPMVKTPNEKIRWYVKDLLQTTDLVNGAVSGTTATTIQVDNADRFAPSDIWMFFRTGEHVKVTASNTGTNQITVIRAVSALNSEGGTAAAAINDNDKMVRMASGAVGETSTRVSALTTDETEVYNYCMQIRADPSITRRQAIRKFETVDEWQEILKTVFDEVKMGMNRQLTGGQRANFTNESSSKETHTIGMRNVPTTHTFNPGGTMYEYALDDFLLKKGFRDGNQSEKTLLCSNDVMLAFNQMTKDRLSYAPIGLGTLHGATGLQTMLYMGPNGEKLRLVKDQHMSDAYPGEAIGIDTSALKRAVMGSDGALSLRMNTGDPDDKGKTAEIFADEGLLYGDERHHFKITGVSGGAAGSASI